MKREYFKIALYKMIDAHLDQNDGKLTYKDCDDLADRLVLGIEDLGMLPPTMIRSVYDIDGNHVCNQLSNKFEEDLHQNDEDLNVFKTDTVTEWKEVKRTT